jgi:hypothetical protein
MTRANITSASGVSIGTETATRQRAQPHDAGALRTVRPHAWRATGTRAAANAARALVWEPRSACLVRATSVELDAGRPPPDPDTGATNMPLTCRNTPSRRRDLSTMMLRSQTTAAHRNIGPGQEFYVGLGRIELPTSALSVRLSP